MIGIMAWTDALSAYNRSIDTMLHLQGIVSTRNAARNV
jgi:hypothetical protein